MNHTCMDSMACVGRKSAEIPWPDTDSSSSGSPLLAGLVLVLVLVGLAYHWGARACHWAAR